MWLSSLPVSEERRLLAQVVSYVADLAAPLSEGASGARMHEAHMCLEIPQWEDMLAVIAGNSKLTIREARAASCVHSARMVAGWLRGFRS